MFEKRKKKVPELPSPSPEELLKIMKIPVLGSIGDDDEAMGFKWKKKGTQDSGRTCRGKRGGERSSESTE